MYWNYYGIGTKRACRLPQITRILSRKNVPKRKRAKRKTYSQYCESVSSVKYTKARCVSLEIYRCPVSVDIDQQREREPVKSCASTCTRTILQECQGASKMTDHIWNEK